MLNNDRRFDSTSAAGQLFSSSSISLSETNTSPTKLASNSPDIHTTKWLNKGHHRTCSSPIQFLSTHANNQANTYVNAASRLSDSDSCDEDSHQRIFVNSKILNDNQTQEVSYETLFDLFQ